MAQLSPPSLQRYDQKEELANTGWKRSNSTLCTPGTVLAFNIHCRMRSQSVLLGKYWYPFIHSPSRVTSM